MPASQLVPHASAKQFFLSPCSFGPTSTLAKLITRHFNVTRNQHDEFEEYDDDDDDDDGDVFGTSTDPVKYLWQLDD